MRALHTVPVIAEAAAGQSRGKYVPVAAERVRAIKRAWPAILARIEPLLITADEAAGMLRAVGGVYHPQQIGVSMRRLRQTYYQAQTIRSRYTVLDLLWEVGLLDDTVTSLFAPGGYWADHPEP